MTEPGTGRVPVPDCTGGSGSGAKFSSGRVLIATLLYDIISFDRQK